MLPLRRAMGTMSAQDFESTLVFFHSEHRNLKGSNVQLAREFLVYPGSLQIVIAERNNVSRQLVYKQCKRLYKAYCDMMAMGKSGSQ